MRPSDTSPEAQAIMDDYYRHMTHAEKGATLRRAYHSARALQLAGLRERFPDADEEELELELAKIWLGDELFERVQA